MVKIVNQMDLIEPSSSFIESYRTALAEFEGLGIFGFWKHFGAVDDADAYIQRIRRYTHRSGISEANIVPASVYWLVDGAEFIGHVSVRHELNDELKKRGGHIGYAIRPTKHGQGYGTQILRLVLPHARTIGIHNALLTCNSDNVASRKIIETNGGQLIDEILVNGKPVLRFEICL